MARRILLVLLSLVLIVVVLAGGLVAWIAWFPNTLKPPLERLLSAQLGRELRIEGPLEVDLGRITTVELHGLEVAAPEWAQAENLAAVERLRVGVDLGAYLSERRVRVTELTLDQPRVALERDAQGRTSWPTPEQAQAPEPQAAEGAPLPEIGALTIRDGQLGYLDAMTDVRLETAVATGTAGDREGFAGLMLDGEGSVRGDPLQLAFRVGSPATLGQAGTPLPIQGELTLAGTRVRLDGELKEPAAVRGLDLAFELASEDPRGLLALAGRPVDAPLPPLNATARLTRGDAAFRLEPLQASWGESRVEGWLSYDPAPARPRIEGELRAPLLDLVPVWPVLTAGGPEEPPSPNPLSVLAPYDADVDIEIGEVRLPQLEIAEATSHLRLNQGGLTVDPLRVVLPKGELSGRIATAPLDQPLAAELTLDSRGLDLAALVPGSDRFAGVIGGRLTGTVRGTALEALLAQSRLRFDGRAEGLRVPYFRADELVTVAALDGGRLTLDPLHATLPEGRMSGRLVGGPLNKDLAIEGRIEAENTPVSTFMGEGGDYAGVITGTLEGNAPVLSFTNLLNQGRLRFDGRATGVRIPQAELGDLVTKAQLEGGRLTLDPIRAELPEGRVAGKVAAGPFGEGFTADLDLDADAVDLGAIARTDAVAGVLGADITGTLRGSSAAEILAQSNLRLDGRVDRLKLPQLGERVPRATLTGRLDPEQKQPLRLVAEGSVGDTPLRVTANGGPAEALAENRGNIPLAIEVSLGKTTATANGSITLPVTERRFTADVAVEGPDPAPVLALFELPEMKLPPYRIEGDIAGRGTSFKVTKLDGRVGDSDIGGDLALSLDGPRPKISGELRSQRLDADDFGGLVGAEPGTGAGETASGRQRQEAAREEQDGQVIPDERVEPGHWQKVDLDLELAAARVDAGRIPFDAFDAGVTLEDGLLRVRPLTLRIGDGRVQGHVELDARRAPVRADLDLELLRLPVARLLNRLDVDTATFGTLSGRARGGMGVEGAGMSVKQILGNADGEMTLVMQGGSIDRTIVTGLGFDLLGLFGSFLGATPEQVELRCTLADLAVRDGIVRTRSLVLDTPIADIGGEGTINLETERIDMELLARPEGTASPTDRTGISIGGTLAEPQVNLNPVALAARGAAAATLGVLLKPFTSLASALGGGEGQPSPCAEVLARQNEG